MRQLLFESAGRPGYSHLKLPVADLKAAIFSHDEFTAYNASITALFEKWKKIHAPRLKSIAIGDKPKALIETLSEDLLVTFGKAQLIDPYDIYQHLMDYWVETMQDDVYMLVQESWKAVLEGKPNTDLIPQPLIIARYFSAEQTTIEKLEADRDAITQQMSL